MLCQQKEALPIALFFNYDMEIIPGARKKAQRAKGAKRGKARSGEMPRAGGASLLIVHC
jgi:hypothetical protein